jgi:soluble lytic murein transglycosylase-like protein
MMKRQVGLRFGRRPASDGMEDLRDQLRDARQIPSRRLLAALALGLGILASLNLVWIAGSVRPRLAEAEAAIETARAGERDALGRNSLMELQVESLHDIVDYSARYRIPADLAQAIYEIALSEDLAPELAFRLVATESSFRRNALSEAGAIGYTQIVPSTAVWLDSRVAEADLYERDVNLRLGFRYLRLLVEQNEGDMRLALLAYNRGPGTVRTIVAQGGDPANGYATRIMGSD